MVSQNCLGDAAGINMSNWFTVEKIDNTTFAISEYGHREKAHSYLLTGITCALLIDTGLGIENIKAVVCSLTDQPVKVVTTHAHWDHIGGHALFTDIAVHKEDAGWLEKGLPIPEPVIKNYVTEGICSLDIPEDFDIRHYMVYTGTPTRVLKDNDIIDIGNRQLRVIHTPGHSPGHICLLEEIKGYLFTGDLIYKGTLYAFYPSTNPLQFKQSVDKINCLRHLNKILPGHNDLEVNPDFLQKVKVGFEDIENQGLLKQGSGTFSFDEFKIQI